MQNLCGSFQFVCVIEGRVRGANIEADGERRRGAVERSDENAPGTRCRRPALPLPGVLPHREFLISYFFVKFRRIFEGILQRVSVYPHWQPTKISTR